MIPVEVFRAGQAAVDRLPHEIGQPALRVQSVAGVVQTLRDDELQPEAFVQLTDQNQADVGGDARPLEGDSQKSVELKWPVVFFVRRVSSTVAAFMASKRIKIGRDE